MAPKIVLTYFDMGGAAESTRWALEIAGVDWEDKRLSRQQFMEMKPGLPNGQVPIAEVDGKVLAQSMAILRYVGKRGGLYPTDDFEAAKCDSTLDCAGDLYVNLRPSLFEKDVAKKMEMRKDMVNDYLPRWLGNMEKQLKDAGGKFFADGKMTIADVQMANRLWWLESGILDGFPTDINAPYPHLRANMEAVLSHPKVKAFREKHSKK